MGRGKESEIQEAAVRLFEKRGYHATSMQEIADAVGLQKGSLYYYITSKEELLLKIVRQAITEHNVRLEEIVHRPVPAGERLAQAIRAHLEATAQDVAIMTIFLRESHALTAEQRAALDAASTRYRVLFTGLIREGIASGEFRAADPEVTGLALIGACNWFHAWYNPMGRLSLDKITTEFVSLALQGLQNPLH